MLVRIETSPEDLRGMAVAQGILHNARRYDISRSRSSPRYGQMLCVRCRRNPCRLQRKTVEMGGKVYKEGDWISLNGSTGEVYNGQVPTTEPELGGDFGAIMNLCVKIHQDTRPHQRRLTPRRKAGPPLRRTGHRSLPHRTHVLRRRPHQSCTRNDPRI